jgi:hypothetical protein
MPSVDRPTSRCHLHHLRPPRPLRGGGRTGRTGRTPCRTFAMCREWEPASAPPPRLEGEQDAAEMWRGSRAGSPWRWCFPIGCCVLPVWRPARLWRTPTGCLPLALCAPANGPRRFPAKGRAGCRRWPPHRVQCLHRGAGADALRTAQAVRPAMHGVWSSGWGNVPVPIRQAIGPME